MDRRKLAMAGGVLVVILVAAAWAMGWFQGQDPAVAQLQQLAGQAFDRDLPDAQRDAWRDQFRAQMQSLSEEQRRAFFAANRDQWMSRAEQRLDEFFRMSPQEQRRELDEMLNRMTQPRPERRDGDGGRGDANGRGEGRGGRGEGRGGWGNVTPAQREARSKRRLDSTSPKMRAQFSEYRRRLAARAKERGISEDQIRWRGPGGRRA